MDTENESQQVNDNTVNEKQELTDSISKWRKQPYTLNEFPQLVEKVNSGDILAQHYGIIGFRKLLSVEDNPPIDLVIHSNLIPRFIQFLERDDQQHLQMEAAWALTNVASGTSQHVAFVVNNGIIPQFLRLFFSPHSEIVEQVIWGLGNIAGDCSIFRDLILEQGGLKILLDYLQKESGLKISIKRVGAWTLSNFCRGRPQPPLELIKEAIPFFCAVIEQETDKEVLNDSLWGLAYLADLDYDTQTLIPMEIVPLIMKYLDMRPEFTCPCLRIIGGIALSQQSKVLIQVPDLIPLLFKTVNEQSKSSLRREACWILSNLTAGSCEEIEAVFKDPLHIQTLVKTAQTDQENTKREIVITFSNALKGCNSDQAMRLVENGALDCFISLLDSLDKRLVISVFEGIKNLLAQGRRIEEENRENPFTSLIEGKGGLEKINNLVDHPNNEVSQEATKVLEEFFDNEKKF